jgi:hypothetical protein
VIPCNHGAGRHNRVSGVAYAVRAVIQTGGAIADEK